jgi:hypothetical protein
MITAMRRNVDHGERHSKISAAAVRAIDGQGLDRVRLVDAAKRAECMTGAVSHPALALFHLHREASHLLTALDFAPLSNPMNGQANAHGSTEPATAPPTQQRSHIPNAQAEEKTA